LGRPCRDAGVVQPLDAAERDGVRGMARRHDAVPMPFDHGRELLERLEPLPLECRVPVLEECPGPGVASVVPPLPERFLEQGGRVEPPGGGEPRRERPAAIEVQVLPVRQQGLAVALEATARPALRARILGPAHVIERIVQMAQDVDCVEHALGLRGVLMRGVVPSFSAGHGVHGHRTGPCPAARAPRAVSRGVRAPPVQILHARAAVRTADAHPFECTLDAKAGRTQIPCPHHGAGRNRLIARNGPGVSESFVYDALGRRTSKTINASTGLSTGSVTTGFLYDGHDIVAEMQGGAISAFYLRSLNIDEPFIRITSTGNEFYHTDALGSTLALTNQSGAVTTTYSYEPFGRTQITGTSTNPFQYTGRENDGTGLYYYRARYYSPTLQRFVSEDPIGFAGGQTNFYAYVWNSPTNWIDPFGLWTYAQEYGTTGSNLQEGILQIEETVDKTFNVTAGRDAIITFATNGTHKKNSLHYTGNAIDLRTRDLSPKQFNDVSRNLSRNLGKNYDVVREGDHIHVEYQPKLPPPCGRKC